MLGGGPAMGDSEHDIWAGDAASVRVVVRSRPLSAREKVAECTECVQKIDRDQLRLGSKYFTYDLVYDNTVMQDDIYKDCVAKLVEGCFGGYNATVLAYGQTGSGKTYTMGSTSSDTVLEEEQGIIPRAIRHIYEEVAERQRKSPGLTFKITVSFIEIYNEEMKDLLDHSPGKNKVLSLREGPHGSIQVMGAHEEYVGSFDEMITCLDRGTVGRSVGSTSMNAVSSRSHAIFTVTIEQNHEGVAENADPNAAKVEGGAASLESIATGESDVNPSHSSSIVSKFHFVDLAGSERAKRTQAAGDRLKEGININYGLLVLGNVISALGDESRKATHVPYRDSKLTRMLQDSIGGNSRTLMIACISPADSNLTESYNTLVYANRARNIKNKPVVNRDPREQMLAMLHEKIARLQCERDAALRHAGLQDSDVEALAAAKADPDALKREEAMMDEVRRARKDNVKLLERLERAEEAADKEKERANTAEEEAKAARYSRDRYRSKLEELTGEPQPEEGDEAQEATVFDQQERLIEELKGMLSRVQSEMEGLKTHVMKKEKDLAKDETIFSSQKQQIRESKKQIDALIAENRIMSRMSMSPAVAPRGEGKSPSSLSSTPSDPNDAKKDSPTQIGDVRRRLDSVCDMRNTGLMSDDEMDTPIVENEADTMIAEEEERRWRQGLLYLEGEIKDVGVTIDSKEKLLNQLVTAQREHDRLKEIYEQTIVACEAEVKKAQKEKEKASQAVERVHAQDEAEKERLRKEYQVKVKTLEAHVAKLRKEEHGFKRFKEEREKQQRQIRELQSEIVSSKQQRALLQKKIKEDQEKYREWRARHHKEVQSLKRTAQKAEILIKRLERDLVQKDSICKRLLEEKAASQRTNREIALANARTAKGGMGGMHGMGLNGDSTPRGNINTSVKTRSQVKDTEKIDRYKMNRWKAKLKQMIEEYGMRGKAQAEMQRLKSVLKSITADLKEARAKRDKLQLEAERRSAVAASERREAWGTEGEGVMRRTSLGSGSQSPMESDEDEGAAMLVQVNDEVEELETKADYHKERIAEIERRLRKLPDLDSPAGVWTDDDTVAVPEAYAPIVDCNGAEARFLLRFLFKKAAMFREAEIKGKAQVDLQRLATEEEKRSREQSVSALRRAESAFEQRCTALQWDHQTAIMDLYARINGECEGSDAGDKDTVLRSRGEEVAVLRKAVADLKEQVAAQADEAREAQRIVRDKERIQTAGICSTAASPAATGGSSPQQRSLLNSLSPQQRPLHHVGGAPPAAESSESVKSLHQKLSAIKGCFPLRTASTAPQGSSPRTISAPQGGSPRTISAPQGSSPHPPIAEAMSPAKKRDKNDKECSEGCPLVVIDLESDAEGSTPKAAEGCKAHAPNEPAPGFSLPASACSTDVGPSLALSAAAKVPKLTLPTGGSHTPNKAPEDPELTPEMLSDPAILSEVLKIAASMPRPPEASMFTPARPEAVSRSVEASSTPSFMLNPTPKTSSAFKTSVFERLNLQRNKVGQSKYRTLERHRYRIIALPCFAEWAELRGEKAREKQEKADRAGRKELRDKAAAQSVGIDATQSPLRERAGDVPEGHIKGLARIEAVATPEHVLPDKENHGQNTAYLTSHIGEEHLQKVLGAHNDAVLTPRQTKLQGESKSGLTPRSGDVFARLHDPESYTGMYKQLSGKPHGSHT